MDLKSNPSAFPKTNQVSFDQESFKRYAKKIEPLLNKPQNRVYTATVLSFLVVSLFMWYAIRPTMQTIFSLRREISDNIEVSKQMEQKISALVEAQATYQSISPKLPLLQQALPENPTPVSLLFSIRQLASESQATISALQLPKTDILSPPATQSGSAQANQVSTVTVSVSVDGTYEQVKSFFTGLTALRRIVTIESVTMSTIESGDETQPEKLVRLMTKLQAYYLPGGSL